jgi:nucleotide-binding universal stress UspA family protein
MKTLEAAAHISLKNVLFATDFSVNSNAALPYAVAVSRLYGAKLYATHVLSPESYVFYATPESWLAVREEAEVLQQAAAERLEGQLKGVPHQVLSAVGDIADVLFRLVREHEIDLLVLGTHGRSGLKKLLMGSVAEKIFRQAPCPVLTVGPHAAIEEKKAAEFSCIVFATDFSPESLAALPYATSLAQQRQAHLLILHVLQTTEAATVNPEANADFVVRLMHELAPPNPDLWFQPEYFVEFGSAPERILQFAANCCADLIVMGVRAPSGSIGSVTHFAHSTAQQVVAEASCPVLTVRG